MILIVWEESKNSTVGLIEILVRHTVGRFAASQSDVTDVIIDAIIIN